MTGEMKSNWIKFFRLTILPIIIITTLYLIFSYDLAGYRYFKNTATQIEIIPFNYEWDERIIIKDHHTVDEILSLIKGSDYYYKKDFVSDYEEVQIIIRRNFATNDLSWAVRSDNNHTILTPLLRKTNDYKIDIRLIDLLRQIIEDSK